MGHGKERGSSSYESDRERTGTDANKPLRSLVSDPGVKMNIPHQKNGDKFSVRTTSRSMRQTENEKGKEDLTMWLYSKHIPPLLTHPFFSAWQSTIRLLLILHIRTCSKKLLLLGKDDQCVVNTSNFALCCMPNT